MDIVDIMTSQLKALGIGNGDTVLIHSSLKSLGEQVSPEQVINALINAVGSDGTVVFPALSYLHCNKNKPIFDYYNTPSNVGAIPEYFRTKTKGVVRSICPTHSCCAVGKHADYVTSVHVLDTTPCGENSPFRRVKELGGKILFLGCGMRPNTSMHAVEELYEPDYLFGDTYEYKITDREGNLFVHYCRAHNFAGVAQRYDRLEELLEAGTELKTGFVLKAHCHLVDAEAMWVKAGRKYSEDPHYFIDFINS
jgi:aminoglycoside 3-N-acetyltransferase